MVAMAAIFYRSLNILWSYHIKYFILNSDDSVQDHPKDNGPKLKLNNFYGNTRINWKRNNGNLKFTPAQINAFLVETWLAFKLSYVTISL